MRWKFQTDMNRSHSKIPPTPSNFPLSLRGVQIRRAFPVIVITPDSEHPLTFRPISLSHLEFSLSVTSASDAYVVYTFEVGLSRWSMCQLTD